MGTPNPDNGVPIQYYLKNPRSDAANVVITNSNGAEVGRLKGESAAGINTVVWNMLAQGRPGGGRGRGGPGYSPETWVPLGDYVVTLEVGGQKLTQPVKITKTQGW